MAQSYISARCKKILYMIIATDNYISLQNISEELGLSKRSVYYEICKINDWLDEQGIDEIDVVRGKGIKLDEDIRRKIELAMGNGKSHDNYIFSPMERIYFAICFIIKSKDAVSVDKLSECLKVSRNTIFNDLRIVVNQLQDYDLNLEYHSKKGYVITGDCIRIRALFILFFNMLKPVNDSEIFETLVGENYSSEYLEKLEEIEKRLNNSYVEGTLKSLSMLIPLMEENNSDLYFADLKEEELKNTREFKLVEEYFPKLCDKEKIYLSLHLLGSRVSVNTVDVFDSESTQSVYEIAKALVAEFEKVACVNFENRDELEKSLYLHLNTSMYRFQYGIQIGNPMLEDISREYPELLEITKIVSRYLEHQIGLPISDGEVAYLALHFGAHLNREKANAERVRVLIICRNGISAGNMIKHELMTMLTNIEIVGVVSTSEVVNVQNICDIVVSTIQMKCLVPVLVVHPILTDFDRKLILNHSIFKSSVGKVDLEELYSRIKPLVPKEKHEDLKNELIHYFENNCAEPIVVFDKKKQGLLDTLSVHNISVEKESYTWEKAIKYVGNPLIENGTIEPQYISNIISQIRYYGPYMFITKDVVLAHVKPEGYVNDMGVSMSVFHNPIVFSDFYKAKVIILMAVKEQDKHLRVLKDIMTLFSVEGNADKLSKLETTQEVIHFLEERLK